jgi:pilus assembly protein CpaB
LTINELRTVDWPSDMVLEGSYADPIDLVGRVLVTRLIYGEPVLDSKLAPEGVLGGVSSLIPAGMRAITVAVNVVSGVGGFILPNAKVDILVTVNPTTLKENATTRIILQDITILAVDQTYRTEDNDPIQVKSVTLLVNPEQAEQLALASTEGKLQLMLRNGVDSDTTETDGARLTQLITGPPRPEPAPVIRTTTARRSTPARPSPPVVEEPVPTVKTIEVIRSNVRSEIKFDGNSLAPDSTK